MITKNNCKHLNLHKVQETYYDYRGSSFTTGGMSNQYKVCSDCCRLVPYCDHGDGFKLLHHQEFKYPIYVCKKCGISDTIPVEVRNAIKIKDIEDTLLALKDEEK